MIFSWVQMLSAAYFLMVRRVTHSEPLWHLRHNYDGFCVVKHLEYPQQQQFPVSQLCARFKNTFILNITLGGTWKNVQDFGGMVITSSPQAILSQMEMHNWCNVTTPSTQSSTTSTNLTVRPCGLRLTECLSKSPVYNLVFTSCIEARVAWLMHIHEPSAPLCTIHILQAISVWPKSYRVSYKKDPQTHSD